VLDAPLGEVARTVRTLLSSMPVIPWRFIELAQEAIQADIQTCKERLRFLSERK
jgi:hypothetical protein